MKTLIADFSWISLFIIIIGVILSIRKSQKTSSTNPVKISKHKSVENQKEADKLPIELKSEKESISQIEEESVPIEEPTEGEHSFEFDIRQAVISSEILRRPDY